MDGVIQMRVYLKVLQVGKIKAIDRSIQKKCIDEFYGRARLEQ